MKPEQWAHVVTTNSTSLYNLTRPVVKQMALQRRGRFVSVASTADQPELKARSITPPQMLPSSARPNPSPAKWPHAASRSTCSPWLHRDQPAGWFATGTTLGANPGGPFRRNGGSPRCCLEHRAQAPLRFCKPPPEMLGERDENVARSGTYSGKKRFNCGVVMTRSTNVNVPLFRAS